MKTFNGDNMKNILWAVWILAVLFFYVIIFFIPNITKILGR